MIRLSDAFTLAYTKLKTRKVRSIVTAAIASLLFSLLVVAILVITGVINSARNFTEGGLTERFVTSVVTFQNGDVGGSPKVQARAQQIHEQLIAEKTAEAKRLGIEYDPNSEPKPVEDFGDGDRYLDMSSPAARQAAAEYVSEQPTVVESAKKLAEPYNPIAVYETDYSQIDGEATVMKDGKEILKRDDQPVGPSDDGGLGAGWVYMDQAVSESFLLPSEQLDRQKNRSAIPIIAPYNYVEKALGLEKLPRSASREDQLERIREVRSRASGVTFDVCYRNHASMQLVEQARQQGDEIKKNENNREYQKPSLIYGLPDPATCGAAPIISDTRSAQEKDYASKLESFETKFNPESQPDQQKISFRVVGIAPGSPDYTTFNTVDGVISMVAGQSLQGLWVVPNHLYEQLPNKSDYEKFRLTSGSNDNFTNPGMYWVGQLVEFGSSEDARGFIDSMSCESAYCNQDTIATYFGSNSALIDDITDGSRRVIEVAGLIIAGIAAIIMMGMVGRVITDSRRETAVFRAIGARRIDINAVYIIYTIMFALLIAAISLVIGLAVASWVDISWGDRATVSAQLAFAGAKDGEVFRLIGFSAPALLAAVGLILLAGLLSVALPLARNVRRSPLSDMRDDQ